MKNLKSLSIALAVIGLLLGTLLVGWYGFDRIVTAMLSAGVGGFALFCLWQLFLLGILGVAWWSIVPAAAPGRRLAVFVWGRMVRDSAASCLPFSAVGGFVLGARAVTLHGIAWPVASISTIVDLTTEFVSEVVFAAFGLVILLTRSSDTAVTAPAGIGLAMALIVGVAAVRLQRGVAPVFIRLGQRILGRWQRDDGEAEAAAQVELAAMYGDTRRLASGTATYLLGWFGKGIGNWIAFKLLGADIDLLGALAIEGLLHAMLAIAIMVPGYAGVQEAGYLGLGSLFGVPPEISLGVSLLRRARDLAVGIPILVIWQLVEVRRLRFGGPQAENPGGKISG